MNNKKDIVKIDTFASYKPVRVSQELYQVNRCRWRMSVPAYRLLFALAQNIDYSQSDLFPELGFEINAIFKYLGLENNGRRYERLHETLIEVRQGGLDMVTQTNRGSTKYSGYSWITFYEFTTDEKYLRIQINDKVKPFMLGLKQYASIQPKYYLKLSTEYQNWFYPYFKNVVKLGKWRVSIDDLKQALYLENTPSYDPKKTKNANEFFLRKVIGIQLSEKAKRENQLATKEKRKPRPFEWDYIKDKEGHFIGTLAGITTLTDINVTASVEKTGRSYTHLIFFLSEKTKKASLNNRIAEDDFGKPKQREKRTRKTSQIGDLFKTEFSGIVEVNPVYEKVPEARLQIYTESDIKKHAKEMGLPLKDFIERMRLTKMDDGRYCKEY